DEGVSFRSFNWGMNAFSADEDGYPLVEPQRVRAFHSIIVDTRPGNDGFLSSSNVEYVDIGSTEPPALLPMLRLKDGSMQEGNKGTTRLDLIVTLSQNPTRTVTVNYATANGTAQAKSDYTAASGKLTFLPGQTSRTISVSIVTDRKREPTETFTVKL